MTSNTQIPKKSNRPECFRIIVSGEFPKKKRRLLPNRFAKRQEARRFCRNNQYNYENMIIVHPDGTEEPSPQKD